MKKSVFFALFIILIPKTVTAYEYGSLNISTPASLEARQMEFKVQHRFYGRVSEKPFDTFFGMDLGANVGLSLRYFVWSKLELKGSYIRDEKERAIGASYTYPIPAIPIRSLAEIQFFTYKEYNIKKALEESKNGIFSLISFQSEPIAKRLIPSLNTGYDSYNKKIGAGIGLSIIVFRNLGLIKKIIALGEYFPTKGEGERKNCYAFGLRAETYGHHFDLLLGNNTEIAIRRLMLGTTRPDGLYFGFNIKRLLGS